MAKKPPRANRRVNGNVHVDLPIFLRGLARALDWEGPEHSLGSPGSYESTSGVSHTPGRFAVNYLFSEIMSKFDDESLESDKLKEEKAFEKFFEAERLCAETNLYFHKIAGYSNPDDVPPDTNPDVWRVLLLAKRKIGNLLGDFRWDEAATGFRFTGGASAKMPRTRSAPANKYSTKVEITPGTEPLARAALQLNPAWGFRMGDEPFTRVEGNRVLCVPKNYKQHRVIAAEPAGNMYFQKGIGSYLSRCLRKVGVDLRSQEQNQDWARLGSKTGLVATVDLSMASDTMSKGVVEWVFPPELVEACGMCRSEFGLVPDGRKVLYRKWSSMGNATTFELESHLFLGVARAAAALSGCDERFVTVYGDDVIIPSGACDLFLRSIARCGFVPNEKKTFFSGPFRESCGEHYFQGESVKPFYIRRQPKDLLDLFLLVNNCRRWLERVREHLEPEQVERVHSVLRNMRTLAPSEWRRPRIPLNNCGDGAFAGTFDEARPKRPRGKYLWWDGWEVEVIVDSRKRITRCAESEFLNIGGVMLSMLETLELGNLLNFDDPYLEYPDKVGGVLPNRKKRFKTTTMIVEQF